MSRNKKEASQSESRWDRFRSHIHVNKALLPLKAVMFLFYGALTAVLLPYITLHMLQIGITIEEVGIIYAVLPFASCLGPPTAGMIADKIGNYKAVLMGSIIATGGFHTLLLTIDAHGIDPSTTLVASTNNQSSSVINMVYLACDESGRTLLSLPNDCANSTCPMGNFSHNKPTVHLVASECVQFCNGTASSVDLCLMTDSTDCYRSNADGFFLQLDVGNRSVNSATIESPDLCALPVNHMLLKNSSQTATLSCDCPVQCPALTTEPWLSCPASDAPTQDYDHYKHQKGFWFYLIVRILATASLGTSFTMLDATTICLIKKYKGQLGRQRLFGVLGSATFAVTTGILLDWAASLNNGVRDYATAFYFSDVLLVLVLIFLFMVEVSAEKAEGNFMKNVFKVLRLIHIDVFMLMMLLLGIFWGFLEAFLFIFLIELNASSYLLGFTVTLGALVGVPFLYVSDIIVKKIGKLVVLISAFFVYSVRFIGYSFITDPWMSLPFEALEAVTIHLMGVSCSMYCAAAAPTGLLATLQGMAGSCHYSIGRGTGSFVGGILIAMYGTRSTFRILGISSGICGVLYSIFYCAYMRKHQYLDEQRRKSSVYDVEDIRGAEVVFSPVSQHDTQEEKR